MATEWALAIDYGAALGFLVSLVAPVTSNPISDSPFTAQELANEQVLHPQLSPYWTGSGIRECHKKKRKVKKRRKSKDSALKQKLNSGRYVQ